jgi:hypothetical protein
MRTNAFFKKKLKILNHNDGCASARHAGSGGGCPQELSKGMYLLSLLD